LKPYLAGDTKTMSAGLDSVLQPNITPTHGLNSVGSKFDQGVTQHRVDKISQVYDPAAPVNYDGSGITVGVLSDSFDTRGSGSTAASAMATFDLPGDPSNPYNTTPVAVLQDDPAQTDEGRGMAEIVYKMAPRAKIGFATADFGEVGFANNIRALSGKFPSVPNTQPGFSASVICDDVSYGGEPVFSDGGVIANGVDDVAAQGVAYFSSASNSYGVSVINSPLRWVPNGSGLTAATNSALVGTNIDLTGVPTDLYQGGFHNWNPNGQDIAALWNIQAGGALAEVQWNDPYDSNPVVNEPPIFTGNGNVATANQVVNFGPFSFTANNQYVIKVAADNSGIDVVVTVTRDSDSKLIIRQDTGTDETVNFFPPTTGNYTVGVTGLDGSTGAFTIKINTGNGTPLLSTDINLLVFRADNGAYLPDSSLVTNNIANNRPLELGGVFPVTGQPQVQFVIARSFIPSAAHPADYLRCSTAANSNPNNAPAEYFDYNSSVTGGHNTAAGANGCAAYDVFRPNVPQNFTSGGPSLIFFDKNNNRLATPELRLTPHVAAANNANTTWLTNDSGNDVDTGGGQFGGTSASAPHAAAIAALVQQAHGGPSSVTPAQMTTILENTAFIHDLDPYVAVGSARTTNGGKVTVTVKSDQTAVQARGRQDPNSHEIAYIGPSTINTFVFNPNGLDSEGGAVTSGRNGVDASNNYFSFVTPGMYFTTAGATGSFAFTPGNSTGLTGADATPTLSNMAPLPATQVPTQGQTLTLAFAAGTFAGGDTFRFTIGRGLTRGPNMANAAGTSASNSNADNFGGGVLLPEGTITTDGIRFSGTLQDGSTFNGRMKNRLGTGFSVLDGYGFINAQAAVTAPLPPATNVQK
jgi:subtilase family protein